MRKCLVSVGVSLSLLLCCMFSLPASAASYPSYTDWASFCTQQGISFGAYYCTVGKWAEDRSRINYYTVSADSYDIIYGTQIVFSSSGWQSYFSGNPYLNDSGWVWYGCYTASASSTYRIVDLQVLEEDPDVYCLVTNVPRPSMTVNIDTTTYDYSSRYVYISSNTSFSNSASDFETAQVPPTEAPTEAPTAAPTAEDGGRELKEAEVMDAGVDVDAGLDAFDSLDVDALNDENTKTAMGFIWAVFSHIVSSFGLMAVITTCLVLLIVGWFLGR